jgi:hypothetical protein
MTRATAKALPLYCGRGDAKKPRSLDFARDDKAKEIGGLKPADGVCGLSFNAGLKACSTA